MTRRTVVVMAKSPVPAQVKTRLVPPLTAVEAAHVAEALLHDTVANALATGAEVVVCLAGPAAPVRDLLADLDPAAAIHLRPQRGATFADRLIAAQHEAFAAGAVQVLLLAADCPTAGPALLRAAFGALARHDGAICRAHDGGYALLATATPTPRLFEGIAMGTDSVHAQTVARAAEGGLSLHDLPPRHDIDRLTDVRAAVAAGQLDDAPTTLALVTALGLLDRVDRPTRVSV